MMKPAWTDSIARSRHAVALRMVGTGTFWVAIGAAIGQGATLAANILVANVLGQKAFGGYAFLQTTQNALALAAQVSLGLAATKYLPEWKSSAPERAGQLLGFGTTFTLATGALAAFGFVAFAEVLGTRLDLPPRAAWGAVISAAAAVPMLTLILFQTGATLGLEAFRAYAVLSAITALFAIALPAAGAHMLGVEGAILGLGCAVVIRAVAGRQLLMSKSAACGVRPRFAGSRDMARLLLDFALPGSLTVIVATFASWSVATLVLRHEGAAQFGLYAVTLTIRQVVLFVPMQLASVSLALMSRRTDQAGDANGRDVFTASLLLTVTLAGSIALIAGLAADEVLAVFGREFVAGRHLLQLMLASALLEAAATSAYQVLPLRGLMWTSLKWVGLPRDLAILLTASLLVPESGVYGGAIALLVGQSIALVGIYATTRAARG